jgi:CheY-like chemotaxis protein
LTDNGRASRRLLLVEDEILVRDTLADELREEGFDVIEAGTGDEAIRLLEQRTDFDVVCTDVRMPGKADGIDVAVCARGRMPSVPVLVVSGYASELGRRLDVLAPPSAFLAKPFRFSDVSGTLRRLLAA